MNAAAEIVTWLNAVANTLGGWMLAPLAVLPGWLSATLVAAVTGVLMLIVLKYTSNQRAIKRVRDVINANLLTLKLFKESPLVALKAQGRMLMGAGQLLVLYLVPTAVMVVPFALILAQLSLWYQQRPLRVGEEAVVTVELHGDTPTSAVSLQPTSAAETIVGPVHVRSKRAMCWNIRAREPGYHRLVFQASGQTIAKELAIGQGFLRISVLRPGRHWAQILLYPGEQPLASDAPIQSIAVAYPDRASWTSGTDAWVIYWFLASTVAAFCFRRRLKVNL